MAVKTAAKLKEAALALLSDSGPDYDIDPSEVRALLDDIVDSAPSLGPNGAIVAALQAVTSDLHAGPPSTGWTDANAAAQGGVSDTPNFLTLAAARALANRDFSLSLSNPPSGALGARLPHGTDPWQARIRFTGDSSGEAYDLPISRMTLLGSSTESPPRWDFYAYNAVVGVGVTALQLQLTEDASHVGQTEFDGKLGPGVVRLQDLTRATLFSAASQGKVKSASFDTGIPRAEWVSASALFKLQTGAANGLLKSVDLPVDALKELPLNTRVGTERTTLLNASGAGRDGYVVAAFTADDTLRLEYARPVTLHTQVVTSNLYEVYEAQLLVRRAI